MRSRVPTFVAFAGFFGIGIAASKPVLAQPHDDRLRLTWEAPAGCPAESKVVGEVARLLGASEVRGAGELTAQARVHRVEEGRWTVHLVTDLAGARGERRLEGDSCQAVASATALILALTLDPGANPPAAAGSSARGPSPGGEGAASAPSRPEANKPEPLSPSSPRTSPRTSQGTSPPTPPGASPAAETPPSPAGPPPSEPRRPSPPVSENEAYAAPASPPAAPSPMSEKPANEAARVPPAATTITAAGGPGPALAVAVRPFVGVATATLPTVAGIAGAGFVVRRRRLEGGLMVWGSQERRARAERPGSGGDFRLFGVAGRACRQLSDGWATVGICAGVALERITADGFGVESPGSGAALLGAGLAAGTLTLPLGKRLDATLEIAGLARPYRPRFVLRGVGPVFTVPALSTLATLGVMVKL